MAQLARRRRLSNADRTRRLNLGLGLNARANGSDLADGGLVVRWTLTAHRAPDKPGGLRRRSAQTERKEREGNDANTGQHQELNR